MAKRTAPRVEDEVKERGTPVWLLEAERRLNKVLADQQFLADISDSLA